MIARPSEQRNPYKGSPPRPWVRLSITSLDGTIHDVELLVDTGNLFAIIISQANMGWLKQGDVPDRNSNFGTLEGGWLHINIPEVGLDQDIVGYASGYGGESKQSNL